MGMNVCLLCSAGQGHTIWSLVGKHLGAAGPDASQSWGEVAVFKVATSRGAGTARVYLTAALTPQGHPHPPVCRFGHTWVLTSRRRFAPHPRPSLLEAAPRPHPSPGPGSGSLSPPPGQGGKSHGIQALAPR